MELVLVIDGYALGSREERFKRYLTTFAVEGKSEGWTMPQVGTVTDRACRFANRWSEDKLPSSAFAECLQDFNAVNGLDLCFSV